jgi:hypothetical protein
MPAPVLSPVSEASMPPMTVALLKSSFGGALASAGAGVANAIAIAPITAHPVARLPIAAILGDSATAM